MTIYTLENGIDYEGNLLAIASDSIEAIKERLKEQWDRYDYFIIAKWSEGIKKGVVSIESGVNKEEAFLMVAGLEFDA